VGNNDLVGVFFLFLHLLWVAGGEAMKGELANAGNLQTHFHAQCPYVDALHIYSHFALSKSFLTSAPAKTSPPLRCRAGRVEKHTQLVSGKLVAGQALLFGLACFSAFYFLRSTKTHNFAHTLNPSCRLLLPRAPSSFLLFRRLRTTATSRWRAKAGSESEWESMDHCTTHTH